MPENGQRRTFAQQDAVARAMEASRRLLDAATKAQTACFEACHESVLGMPGFQDQGAGGGPASWIEIMIPPGFQAGHPLNSEWQKAIGGAMNADEFIAAGKRLCLECVDSCEQVALSAIDLRERVADATNVEWVRSMASTHAGIAREVTKAYVVAVRGLLQ